MSSDGVCPWEKYDKSSTFHYFYYYLEENGQKNSKKIVIFYTELWPEVLLSFFIDKALVEVPPALQWI